MLFPHRVKNEMGLLPERVKNDVRYIIFNEDASPLMNSVRGEYQGMIQWWKSPIGSSTSRIAMTKDARYSTFNPGDSWTARKMLRLSSWMFLGCCCSSCYKRQKPTRALSGSNSAKGSSRTKVLEPIAESNETPSTALVEVPLTGDDYNVSKDEMFAQDVVNSEETSLISRKEDTIDNSSFRNTSLSYKSRGGMKRVIGGLSVFPKKEKQQASSLDERKTSEDDPATGSNAFAKCSKRHIQQRAPLNIPELIIS